MNYFCFATRLQKKSVNFAWNLEMRGELNLGLDMESIRNGYFALNNVETK